MGEALEVTGALVVFLLVPVAASAFLVRLFVRWCATWLADQREAHRSRGGVWGPGLLLQVAMILSLLPAMLLSYAVLLLIIGTTVRDTEMQRIASGLFALGLPMLVLTGVLAACGLAVWIVDEDQLTRRRFGRERSISFADMTHKIEGDPLRGLMIHGSTNGLALKIRISKQVVDYDGLFNQLIAGAPQLLDDRSRGVSVREVSGLAGIARRAPHEFRVTRWRMVVVPMGLLALLTMFMLWPWFLVVGEHKTRDSWLFVGIGLLVWLAGCAFLVSQWLQPKVPWALELGDQELTLRFLGRVESRMASTVQEVSLDTRIVTIRGQTGYRYPLTLRFADGQTVIIDDLRGRQMGSSTQEIAAVIHGRYMTNQPPD